MSKINKSLQGLRDMLFAQLEAVTNPDLSGDELAEEIDRTTAVTKISAQISDSAELELSALKYANSAIDYDVYTEVKQLTGGDSSG